MTRYTLCIVLEEVFEAENAEQAFDMAEEKYGKSASMAVVHEEEEN